jgi:tripartite-type tricarboxylate transporter receptor subunit TctC
VGSELSKALHQPVIVDNKPGANGNIGADWVAKAAPDGYTLLVSGVGSNAISYALYPALPYRNSAFTHISLLATGPNVIVVNNDFPAKTMQEFVAMAKKSPGSLSFASAGTGSSGHLSVEMLKQKLGLDMTHIPYKGFGPASLDVMGGRIPLLAMNQDGALQLVNGHKVRALAVTSKDRNPALPDVPTVSETVAPGFDVVSWFGISAPAGTPPDVVNKLNSAIASSLAAPDVQKFFTSNGFVPAGGTPAAFSTFVDQEISKWGAAVKATGVVNE